jgi:hypothetical protein
MTSNFGGTRGGITISHLLLLAQSNQKIQGVIFKLE